MLSRSGASLVRGQGLGIKLEHAGRAHSPQLSAGSFNSAGRPAMAGAALPANALKYKSEQAPCKYPETHRPASLAGRIGPPGRPGPDFGQAVQHPEADLLEGPAAGRSGSSVQRADWVRGGARPPKPGPLPRTARAEAVSRARGGKADFGQTSSGRRQSGHMASGRSGSQRQAHPSTASKPGSSSIWPRAAVDLAVPFSPTSSTPNQARVHGQKQQGPLHL